MLQVDPRVPRRTDVYESRDRVLGLVDSGSHIPECLYNILISSYRDLCTRTLKFVHTSGFAARSLFPLQVTALLDIR